MKTDSLFYRLFQELPDLVFELADWPAPAGAVYTLHAEEVKQSRIRALPVAELEALGEALLDWCTPAELMAWLQRQG